MKLGQAFRDKESGLLLKLWGVTVGANLLYEPGGQAFVELSFKVLGSRNMFKTKRLRYETFKSCNENVQSLVEAICALVENQFFREHESPTHQPSHATHHTTSDKPSEKHRG